MKERLNALQNQVDEMQRSTHKQQDTQQLDPESQSNPSRDVAGNSVSIHMQGTREDTSKVPSYHVTKTRAITESGLEIGESNESPIGITHDLTHLRRPQVPERLPLGTSHNHTTNSPFCAMPPMDMEFSGSVPQSRYTEISHESLASSFRTAEDSMLHYLPYEATNHVLEVELGGDTAHSANLNTPSFGSHTWTKELPMMMPAVSQSVTRIPTTHGGPDLHQFYGLDTTTTPSTLAAEVDPSEDAVPSLHAPVEERFEYVLRCAQRVGLQGFDTLASQYYARNFNPGSALALEQRLSRNRRLPGLLAELRKESTTWSAWQRRGYEDEILKAAEEICASECREFWRREANSSESGGLDEEGLQETLPNLWALLTGLASSNQHLPYKTVLKVVCQTVQLLYGLRDPIS